MAENFLFDNLVLKEVYLSIFPLIFLHIPFDFYDFMLVWLAMLFVCI